MPAFSISYPSIIAGIVVGLLTVLLAARSPAKKASKVSPLAEMCIRDRFSTMQAARLGWDSYGDTQYPAHVLRYYPYGRAFTSGGNQAIVEVALTQLGNEGGQPYWSWYGFEGRVEWCACFVSWCADQCGYIESGIIPKFAGCVDVYKRQHRNQRKRKRKKRNAARR